MAKKIKKPEVKPVVKTDDITSVFYGHSHRIKRRIAKK